MSTSLPNILVTGANGQLASALKKHADISRGTLVFLDKSTLDITNQTSIEQEILKYKPSIIINTAAYTSVDKAESEIDLAMRVNQDGASNLAMLCKRHHIALIHISTDYVFDGKSKHGYKESDAPNPLNIYGKSKLSGEEAVREQCEKHVILRVSGIFSEYGSNFVKTMLRLAQERDQLNVVSDQFTCPTYADDIAIAILTICNNFSHTGTYHFCSQPVTSWHEFAATIINEATLATPVKAIKTADYSLPAQRPAYSVLDCKKIYKDYGIVQPEWKHAIKNIVPLLMKRNI